MTSSSDDPVPVVTRPSTRAGGLRAVWVTAQHAARQTGPLRALRVLASANQTRGFDCPGCAWPDPPERSLAEFCENGAKAILDEATSARVDRACVESRTLENLRALDELHLNALGRVTRPLLLERGASHAQIVTYEEAYALIAEQLAALPPDSAAFYTSGRASNEAAFAYQLFVRALGTNNLPDCSNLCHESSGVALTQTLGIGKGTVLLEDFDLADLILVVGQNPGTNHPRMLGALRRAKQRGATIVSINPLMEAGLTRFSHPQHVDDLVEGGIDIADWFVRVRVGGDQALFRAVNKCLLQWDEARGGILDHAFLERYTVGLPEFQRACRSSDEGMLEKLSGIDRHTVEHLAKVVCEKRSIIVCWAMGLTQHENAVDTISEVVSFLLLRGNIGRPGAGACPVRGHSNVQGDRTVGITPNIPGVMARRIQARYGFHVRQERGLDAVGTLEALAQRRIDVFVSLGGNFLSACPDTTVTARGLAQCRLTVHVTTKLNRSQLVEAERVLILPCLGRSERDLQHGREQFVSVEDSMGIVHASRGTLAPPDDDVRSEPRIVCELADRVLTQAGRNRPALRWQAWASDYDLIRKEIEAIVPGFDEYNPRVRREGGFELPNGPRQRQFPTESGRAQFVGGPVRCPEPGPGELILMTLRSHDQFNTTVYSNDDRYRGIKNSRRVLMMHPSAMAARGLSTLDRVVITSHYGHGEAAEIRELRDFFVVAYDLPSQNVAAYFPEANALLFTASFAQRSRTPTSKSTRVTVAKQDR